MHALRRHLSCVIACWLACQMAGVAAAPLALYTASAPSGDHAEKCECPVAPGQACPMHRTREGDRTCKMRNASGGSEAALLAPAGGAGVLPTPTVTVSAFDPGAIVLVATPAAIVRIPVPESPPPRA